MILAILQQVFMFSYISGTNSFPKPLTEEEEKKVIEQYMNGDEDAKNILIERNLRLVAHIVKKYNNYNRETEDLISVGSFGLIKAIGTYKPDKGTKLATYAARCIENEILMFLRSAKKHINDVSLQEPIGVDKEGNEVTLEDKFADEDRSTEDKVGLKMQIKSLYEKINKILKGRERTVIELRYGLYEKEEITQREIAEILGISRSYVSRIEKKALKKLQREMS